MNGTDFLTNPKLIEAVKSAQLMELQSLETDLAAAGEHTFSESFETRMNKLLHLSKKPYYYYINTVGKKVAVVIFAVILSFTFVVVNVKAVREPVVAFIIEIYEKFMEVVFPKNIIYPHNIETSYEPKFIPEGYQLTDDMITTYLVRLRFSDSDNNGFEFRQMIFSGDTIWINTASSDCENIEVNGHNYIFLKEDTGNKLVWEQNHYFFQIKGSLSKDDMLRIASSVTEK